MSVSKVLQLKMELIVDGNKTTICKEIAVHPSFDINSIGQDPKEMLTNMFNLFLLSLAKGSAYGDSWRKKGEFLSIFPNIMRKYDRVEKSVMDKVEKGQDQPASRIDGAGDLAVYSLLYLQFLKEQYPSLFAAWMQQDVLNYTEQHLGAEIR